MKLILTRLMLMIFVVIQNIIVHIAEEDLGKAGDEAEAFLESYVNEIITATKETN